VDVEAGGRVGVAVGREAVRVEVVAEAAGAALGRVGFDGDVVLAGAGG